MNRTEWSYLHPAPKLLGRSTGDLAIGSPVDGDLPVIYMMGFDVWGGEWTESQYIAYCHASAKYAKGTWHCARDVTGELAASAITYRLGVDLPESVVGVGSIATEPGKRNRGIASVFLRMLLAEYEAQHDVDVFVLFADRDTTLYDRLGFKLPPMWQATEKPNPLIRCADSESRGAALAKFFVDGLKYF